MFAFNESFVLCWENCKHAHVCLCVCVCIKHPDHGRTFALSMRIEQ